MDRLPNETLRQYCRRLIIGGLDCMYAHLRIRTKESEKMVNDYSGKVNPIIANLYKSDSSLVMSVIGEFLPTFASLDWRKLNPNNLFPQCKKG